MRACSCDSVLTFSLPSSYFTLAVCHSLTYYCCSSNTCHSFSNLTFLFTVSHGLLLSMALKYLLIMEKLFFSLPWCICKLRLWLWQETWCLQAVSRALGCKWNALHIKHNSCSSCSVFVPGSVAVLCQHAADCDESYICQHAHAESTKNYPVLLCVSGI